MLNNLLRVGLKKKNADIICYMLTSLVYLQQGNVKKSENLMKIVNIEGEDLSRKISLENTFLEKPQGSQIDPQPF